MLFNGLLLSCSDQRITFKKIKLIFGPPQKVTKKSENSQNCVISFIFIVFNRIAVGERWPTSFARTMR